MATDKNQQDMDLKDIDEYVSGCNDAKLRELNHDLVERIKELNCLYGISRLIEKRETSINEILQGVVKLIPPAWQYPESTCACIKLKDRRFQTDNYREPIWKQIEVVTVYSRPFGTLEVYYLEEKPHAYEGPFLREERELLHVIAERLGTIIEYKIAEKNIQSLYDREKKLRKKLQSEMQSRVYFTRQLIHELKTPLTSLLATSQLLQEETHGTNLEKLAGYVWEGSNNLNSRIEELHDVIRGEIGLLKLNLKLLDVRKLLFSLVEETYALAQQYGVSVNLDLRKPLPKVHADAVRLRQIIYNLINNAFKYAAEGKSIIIRATQESDLVVIEVQDFGHGIPGSKQRNLFKPGYLINQGESPGGLGIGLTLCKMLVELHGGKIWLESKVGKGSSFFFTLPAPKKNVK